MEESYKTIGAEVQAEHRERGSKFLAFAFPADTAQVFKEKLKAIREEHPKASHHCFAYRFGTEGNEFRASDAGEPSGTAGKPILGQIDSRELTNVAIVVVRYFGGTLLGVPGLIQAYKTAASLALQLTPIVEKPILKIFNLEFDYTIQNDVMTTLKKYNCEIIENELQLFCRMKIGIPKKELDACMEKLSAIHSLRIS